jgi:phosphoserine phosphatase
MIGYQSAMRIPPALFYSDSHNDLPLLEQVDKPIAVDPDDTLRATAEDRHWEIISLR